jgi:hypothetical protein
MLTQSNSSTNEADVYNNVNSAPVETANSVTFSVPSLNIPSTRPQLTVLSPTRDPKTKNEKTEINLTLSNHNSNKSSPVHVQCSQQRIVDNKDNVFKALSSSALPVTNKRKSEKPRKRRHTVGGTDDLENFKALVNVTQSKGESKKSAWEQLQPVVKSPGLNLSLQQWIQNERLRGSTPDLSQNHTQKFF